MYVIFQLQGLLERLYFELGVGCYQFRNGFFFIVVLQKEN